MLLSKCFYVLINRDDFPNQNSYINIDKENASEAMNRIDILMMSKESKNRKQVDNNRNFTGNTSEQLVTFHSRRQSYQPRDSELKIEDLKMTDEKADRQLN
jgi:hypothetical protein